MGFDVDMTELDKLRSSLDDIKDTLTDGLGTDAFDEVIKESKKAGEGIDDIRESIDAIRPDGIEDTVKELKNTDTRAGDAHDALKKLRIPALTKPYRGSRKSPGRWARWPRRPASSWSRGLPQARRAWAC